MGTDLKPLATTITCHCWNGDGSMLAICPNTPEVWIYVNTHDSDVTKWEKKYILNEHDLVVSGMDWHPVTNRLVTCSHDRNAFVWNFLPETDTWKPTIAILRINRAATSVKWSPDGTRFAVASGAKVVPVCTYEEENDWWVSAHVRKHRSTVLALAWHPNSQIIATACADFKCRVMSAIGEGMSPDAGPFAAPIPFGEMYIDFDESRGWVEDVAWSPTGHRLAFIGHDATIHMVQLDPAAEPIVQSIRSTDLPYTCVAFLSENCLVAAGHSLNPSIFACGSDGVWAFTSHVDKKTSKAAASSSFDQRRSMFNKKPGSAGAQAQSDQVWTQHKGAITDVRLMVAGGGGGSAAAGAGAGGSGAPAVGFSTSGIDGRVVKWRLADLDAAALKL